MTQELNGELNKAIVAALLAPGVDTEVAEWKAFNKRIVDIVDSEIAAAVKAETERCAGIVARWAEKFPADEDFEQIAQEIEGEAK